MYPTEFFRVNKIVLYAFARCVDVKANFFRPQKYHFMSDFKFDEGYSVLMNSVTKYRLKRVLSPVYVSR